MILSLLSLQIAINKIMLNFPFLNSTLINANNGLTLNNPQVLASSMPLCIPKLLIADKKLYEI